MDSNTDEQLSETEIFELLAAPRRRAILRMLARRGGEGTFGDLTNEIATGEHGADSDAGTRKSVYVSLYQTHVPRLAEAGVLTYDERTKTVALAGPWPQLMAYLDFDPLARKQGFFSRVLRAKSREQAE